MKTERTLAADYEAVGGVTVGGPTYVERARAACEALGGKANQLAHIGLGANDLRRLASQSPDVLTEKCDELEELTAFVVTRLRALVDASR